ncbi:MAG: 50S ribosomal protein L23 [Thermodesulfobacteriota bacterium]|nr:50S ribosomal protein L23 [Thermodesulfobacteriota bacterium]
MLQHDLIIRPVTTEKTTLQKEMNNQVTFEVEKRANRIEIARAVETIFNTRVAAVRTAHVKGKTKRMGRHIGKRKDWKKAVVTLMPGERIDFFDGV